MVAISRFRRDFLFSCLHGITWRDVARKPRLAEFWPELPKMIGCAAFLAAHNASSDRSVLAACCGMSGLQPPQIPFLCTVALARRVWSITPAKLPTVCDRLGIPLDHHNPASDAEACARIVPAARKEK